MTEICKALMGQVRVLILDEPTSALSTDEEQILFDAVDTVVRQNVGVIYVTHRLNEVFRISNRVTVLRDGVNVGAFNTAETDMRTLVAAIVGPKQAKAEAKPPREDEKPDGAAASSGKRELLALSGIVNDRLRGVDLSLMDGEIHGLAGLIGSGRTEIFLRQFSRCVPLKAANSASTAPPSTCEAQPRPSKKASRSCRKIGRRKDWCSTIRSSAISACLGCRTSLGRAGCGVAPKPKRPRRRSIGCQSRRLALPPASAICPEATSKKLCSPNGTMHAPAFLLLDEPTVGVDVGAREEIYGLIRDAGRAGAGVLVVSSDLHELILLCNRISIVVDGRVTATLGRDEFGDAEHLHELIQMSQRNRDKRRDGSPCDQCRCGGARTAPGLDAGANASAQRMAVDALSGFRRPLCRLQLRFAVVLVDRQFSEHRPADDAGVDRRNWHDLCDHRGPDRSVRRIHPRAFRHGGGPRHGASRQFLVRRRLGWARHGRAGRPPQWNAHHAPRHSLVPRHTLAR